LTEKFSTKIEIHKINSSSPPAMPYSSPAPAYLQPAAMYSSPPATSYSSPASAYSQQTANFYPSYNSPPATSYSNPAPSYTQHDAMSSPPFSSSPGIDFTKLHFGLFPTIFNPQIFDISIQKHQKYISLIMTTILDRYFKSMQGHYSKYKIWLN
jgi:hypothetical protein